MISIQDYIKQEVEELLNFGEIQDSLAEDFDTDEDAIETLIEGIEDTVAENFANNDYYMSNINEWMMDEIKNVIKGKLSNI